MISERIKHARKITGLTQKQLGEKAGIAETTIRKYELGKLNPKLDTLKKIASAIDLPVSFFYGEPPFQNLKELIEIKSIILSSLEDIGLLKNKICIDQVSERDYFFLISLFIDNITLSENDVVSIYYKSVSDKPKNEPVTTKRTIGKISLEIGEEHIELISQFNFLNDKGKEIAIQRIRELTKIEDYTKE